MGVIIVSGVDSGSSAGDGLLSVVFAAGQRPDLAAVQALSRTRDGDVPFAVSHADPAGAWAELLCAGLTFDCHGLAAGPGAATPPGAALVGLESAPTGEAITLVPGPHLAGGRIALPVVRVLAGLGARLASLPGVVAVCWHPAGSWIEPGFFARTVAAWLAGGPFPAPGLVALTDEAVGGMVSHGLAFFTGQELEFADGTGPDTARLAVRLINQLVVTGAVLGPLVLAGPDDRPVQLLPTADRRRVRVRGQA